LSFFIYKVCNEQNARTENTPHTELHSTNHTCPKHTGYTVEDRTVPSVFYLQYAIGNTRMG